MPVSKIGIATRAFVPVLLALARGYQLTLHVNRDSDREALLKAYKARVLAGAAPEPVVAESKNRWNPTPGNYAVEFGRMSLQEWFEDVWAKDVQHSGSRNMFQAQVSQHNACFKDWNCNPRLRRSASSTCTWLPINFAC